MEAQNSQTLVVISYYDRRPIQNLYKLLDSISVHNAGAAFKLCVVVNRTSDDEIVLDCPQLDVKVMYRHNVGMNIGAWDFGWRAVEGYQDVIFLQDDCYVVRDDWVSAFKERLSDPSVGLVGESINHNWDFAWSDLRQRESKVEMPEHEIKGQSANRVDVYLSFFAANGIPQGDTGVHLRSLCWAARRAVLEKINGFPHGRNFGECIGAEIGVCKKIESVGLTAVKVDESAFRYVKHLEWDQDYPGGAFTKNPVIPTQIKQLKKENLRLTESYNRPSWKLILKMIAQRLKIDLKTFVGMKPS